MSFTLHPQLAQDTLPIAELPLSRLLLMNDARFPWLILVPKHKAASEWFDLSADEQSRLTEEISRTARALKAHTRADKINIAALGNQVPQLHIHIIARFKMDAAWPQPVWNCTEPRAFYSAEDAEKLTRALAHLAA